MRVECSLDDIIQHQKAQSSILDASLDEVLSKGLHKAKGTYKRLRGDGAQESRSSRSAIAQVTKRRHIEHSTRARRRPRLVEEDDEETVSDCADERCAPHCTHSRHGGCRSRHCSHSTHCQPIIYNISYGAGVTPLQPPHLISPNHIPAFATSSRVSTAASYSIEADSWPQCYTVESPPLSCSYATGLPPMQRHVSLSSRAKGAREFISDASVTIIEDDDGSDEVQELPALSIGSTDLSTNDGLMSDGPQTRPRKKSHRPPRKLVHGECISLDD